MTSTYIVDIYCPQGSDKKDHIMKIKNGTHIFTFSSTMIATIRTSLLMLLYSLTVINITYAATPSNTPIFDVEPPLIEHTPLPKLQKSNTPLTIEAIITDNNGIQSVWLNYRVKGMENYRVLMMKPTTQSPSLFVGVVPASEVGTETIEYYIQATDTGGNTVLRGGMLFPLSIAFKQPPKLSPNNAFVSNPTRAETTGLFDLPTNSKTAWAWIAGGVIVGALIAKNSDNGDDTSNSPNSGAGIISVTAGNDKL